MQSARDSAQSPTSAAAAVQSPSRRLLSRFASGLASKPRSFIDFHIKLDDDGRHYSTSDTVKGSVRLRVLKPVRITHLVVCLSGRAHVYKNPASSGELYKTSSSNHNVSSKAKSRGQYHGNGLATLFEEEAVLCGDGRLAEGSYQFNFELDFPERDLPSSVDFERGKISYSITASLTRPTTIAPVTTCERVIYFAERIDIAFLYPPKSRTIIHDPLMKRSKTKSPALKLVDANKPRGLPGELLQTGEAAVQPSVSSQENERSLSPVPSEISTESRVSSLGVSSQNGSVGPSASPPASFVSRPTHSKTGHVHKAITTTIETCSGGCLRGDHVTVKVAVNHTKYMKSMNGVLVTLYRHSRVDTQPALPIGPIEKGKNDHKQSYYPRSVTGLGGLSLSGAGSAHIFRKDLAQAVYPLVVNPSTLVAEVTAKLRVPEEVFPTISGVPGAMISFKYYIEVLVDIQGKLSTPLNPLRELTSTNMTPVDSYETDYSNTASHPSRMCDTTHVRKDKTVVCTAFEIIIGTVDSERRKGKQKVVQSEEPQEPVVSQPVSVPPHPPAFDMVEPLNGYYGGQYHAADYHPHYDDGPTNNGGYNTDYHPHYDYGPTNNGGYHTADHLRYDYGPASDSGYDQATIMYPAPPQADESQLSEKDRLRLAEARLLPSQPPGLDNDVDDGAITGATAPQLDEDVGYNPEPAPQDEYSMAGPSSRVLEGAELERWQTARRDDEQQQEEQTVPDQQQASVMAQQPAAGFNPAPDGMIEHTEPVGQGQTVSVHDSHAEASASSDLPRYER